MEELIKSAQNGDKTSFERVVDDCKDYLINLFRERFTGVTNEDMSDIFQIAYLKAWSEIGKFKSNCQFKTWLYAIIKNSALDYIESRNKIHFFECEVIPAEDGEILDYNFIYGGKSADEEIIYRERILEIRCVLDMIQKSLSEKHKEIFQLFFLDGRSYKDISSILNIPIGTVMSRVSWTRNYAKRIYFNNAKSINQ